MFGIHKKLKSWAAAGLITSDQFAAITAHEKSRQQGCFGRGVAGVALFAIVVGVLSLIAANWAAIPPMVKIAAHVLVNIALAVAVWHGDRRGLVPLREGALLVLGGLTLTLIALTGQVFQLGGSLSGALLLWQLAILPAFVIYGQTRLTVVPGLLAMIGSVPVILSEYLSDLPDFWAALFAVAFAVLMPLALIADGHVRVFRRLRPVWCDTSQRLGFVLLVLVATGATFFWYADRLDELTRAITEAGLTVAQGFSALLGVFAAAFAGLAVHWRLYAASAEDPGFYRRIWGLTLASLVVMLLPLVLPGAESSLLAMITFIGYWGFIGWTAHATGAMRLLSLAIALLAIRVWVIYMEAFGGLALTGVGLIIGGVLMLGMIAAARRVNKKLTGKGARHA